MSDNVLREFLVSLGFKVDEVGMKKFVDSVGDVTKTVLKVGLAVSGAAAGVVAGVKIISSQMENLYYASQRTGATVGNIMALRYAAGQIGLTADQAQGSLENFARTLRLNPGSSSLLDSMGVTGKDPAEKFDSFIAKAKTMQPYVAAAYAQLFGIDADTLLMLEQGQDKRLAAEQQYHEKLAAFGIDPDQAARAGVDFDNSIRNLLSDVHLFWVLLEEHLAPVLTAITGKFEKWEAGNADKIAQKIATALEAVALWVSQIDWAEVGKDVDIFLSKAWEVAKVIGNIIGGFAKVAAWFGGDKNSDDKLDASKTPSSQGVPKILDDSHNAHPDDSPFVAWVRKKREAAEQWFSGGNSSSSDESFGTIIELPPASQKPKQDSAARGIRNNNPGNIEYGGFAKSMGATGSDGRFAVFQSMEDGIKAAIKLLEGYVAKGYDTVRSIINRWAPPGENNTSAYVDAVAKKLGISADAHLNGDQLGGVANAIFQHENGRAFGNVSAMNGARLGAGGSTSANINIQQQNTFHIPGSSDPQGTARAVGGEQSRVNGDLVRNFAGAFR